VRRVKLDAHEHLGSNGNALLRQVRRDRMNFPELRRQAIGPAEARCGQAPRAFDAVGRVGKARGIHDFPGQGDPVFRILAQEIVQQGRAGARQADDEGRRLDGFVGDAWSAVELALHVEQILEQADDEFARRDAPDCGEPGFAAVGVEQCGFRGCMTEQPQRLPRMRRVAVVTRAHEAAARGAVRRSAGNNRVSTSRQIRSATSARDRVVSITAHRFGSCAAKARKAVRNWA